MSRLNAFAESWLHDPALEKHGTLSSYGPVQVAGRHTWLYDAATRKRK